MESYMLLGFAGILREALKIFSKIWKLMVSIAIFNLFLCSILYFNIFSTKANINSLLSKQVFLLMTSSNTPEFANLLIGMHKEIRFYLGVEWVELIFVLASSIAFFIFTTATIFASAITHEGKNLSFKDLLSRKVTSCKRLFVTLVYITLFGVGYSFIALAIVLPLALKHLSFTSLALLSIVLSILAVVIYTYITVVWNLALVISVLEERSGVEALGKASQIVKGMHLHPFLLNLLVMMLTFVLFLLLLHFGNKWSSVVQLFLGLVVLNSIYLVRMFMMMAYTVLYYQCKKTHGEEVELQVSMEYNKVSTTPPIEENIP